MGFGELEVGEIVHLGLGKMLYVANLLVGAERGDADLSIMWFWGRLLAEGVRRVSL